MSAPPTDLSDAEPLPDDLARALDRARGSLDRIGHPVYYFSSARSTNDIALQLADAGASDGTTVVADTQTGGRGRLGRTWFSPPGAGLYVSVVLRLTTLDRRLPPPMPIGRAPQPGIPLAARFTLLAGVALAETIRSVTGLPAEIKWPNDLVFGGRKLAGILAEGVYRREVLEYIVLGIGINVRSVEYPPDIAQRASSLERELGREVERGDVLATLLERLGHARLALRHDDVAPWFERWRGLSPSSCGALVEWRAPDGIRRGCTAGLDRDGALLVEAARGLERVLAGEVIWL